MQERTSRHWTGVYGRERVLRAPLREGERGFVSLPLMGAIVCFVLWAVLATPWSSAHAQTEIPLTIAAPERASDVSLRESGADEGAAYVGGGGGGDRHAGSYYPVPQTQETYKARAIRLPDSSRRSRLAFITQITGQQLSRPHPPQFIMFAKGDDAQKLIMVSLVDGQLNTLYRVRALLAMMSAVARATPVFRENQLEDVLTFFDLAYMLGFEQITISDGNVFSHQIKLVE
ncbi:MAG: hypothetical protein AAF220_08410 [Pseudomonadota bacterium]